MSAKIVSFIIPAYNAAETIVRCLDSIYELSLKRDEFEVIVVDDCSTDNTCVVISKYQSQHSNITLLKLLKNSRQGAARNRGVSIAMGDYVCFVDADDEVTEGIVKAIRSAVDYKTDMLPYHLAYADMSGNITKEETHLSFGDGQIFTGIELQNKHSYWFSGPVAYIYNRDFLSIVNYPFAEGVLFEDSDFVLAHLYRAKRMIYSAELGYIAFCREGSTTRGATYKSVADFLLLGIRTLKLYESISPNEQSFAESILEGACWGIAKSCKWMLKLGTINDVIAYYNRIDSFVDRREICADQRLHKYYWNIWTSLLLRHKYMAIFLLTFLLPLYRYIKK